MNYVKRARSAGNRTESAKELKKLIAFNTLVVTELVRDIKGEPADTSLEEPVKEEEKKGTGDSKGEKAEGSRQENGTGEQDASRNIDGGAQ